MYKTLGLGDCYIQIKFSGVVLKSFIQFLPVRTNLFASVSLLAKILDDPLPETVWLEKGEIILYKSYILPSLSLPSVETASESLSVNICSIE